MLINHRARPRLSRARACFIASTVFISATLISFGSATSSQTSARSVDSQPEVVPSTTGTPLPWNVHFWAVPSGDDALFISSGPMAQLSSSVGATVVIGGAPRQFAMTYNASGSVYEAQANDVLLPTTQTAEGTIGLSTDLGNGNILDTGSIDFRRYFVPTVGAQPIVASDNNLEMTLSDHSLATDVYAVVMSANGLPGPLPPGYTLIGKPYSVRPSGAILTSTKPLLLKMFYSTLTLGNRDPHTLRIMQWEPEPVSGRWIDLGGNLDDLFDNSLSTTTDQFGVYALVSTSCWTDAFNDLTGVSVADNVDVLVFSGELVLDGSDSSGTAISRAITPTLSLDSWGTLTYSRTLTNGTSLSIEVLDINNTPIFTNVASGMSLSALNPNAYPSLKLRATLTTDDLAKTPSLDQWSICWHADSLKVYLPLLLMHSPGQGVRSP